VLTILQENISRLVPFLCDRKTHGEWLDEAGLGAVGKQVRKEDVSVRQ
jgi:hypothetical protein